LKAGLPRDEVQMASSSLGAVHLSKGIVAMEQLGTPMSAWSCSMNHEEPSSTAGRAVWHLKVAIWATAAQTMVPQDAILRAPPSRARRCTRTSQQSSIRIPRKSIDLVVSSTRSCRRHSSRPGHASALWPDVSRLLHLVQLFYFISIRISHESHFCVTPTRAVWV